MRRLRHRAVAVALITAALVAVAGISEAHDFWLVPNAFHVAEGGTIEVHGQTSSKFPTSESAVAPDRLAEARIIGGGEDVRITDVSTSGASLRLRHRPRSSGQRLVAVSIAPRSVRASGRDFKRYIELEGNVALAARYEREGVLPKTDSITRRYAKYAKTFVEVGRGGPRIFSRVVNQPLEFVPSSDPATLTVGDTLALRLLYQGRPLGEMTAHAGVGGTDGELHPITLSTGRDGVLRVPLSHAGLWNVRTLHVVPAPAGSGADWESHFSTVVFSVRGNGGAAAPGAPGDSVAVLEVVARFQRALATSDSAEALRLLAPDAVILESGGVESVAEYRAHHLPADIAFSAAVPSRRTVTRVVVRGDMGLVASTSSTQGEFRGRAIDSAGAELIVLIRTREGWRISAIHWSSRARRP